MPVEEQKQKIAEELRACFTMDKLWEALCIMENHTFYTAKGLEFRYVIRGYEIFVDRKVNSKSITRSSVEIAYGILQDRIRAGEQIPLSVKGPKKLGVFGASYLYPVFIELGIIS